MKTSAKDLAVTKRTVFHLDGKEGLSLFFLTSINSMIPVLVACPFGVICSDYQFLTRSTRSPSTRDVYGSAFPPPRLEVFFSSPHYDSFFFFFSTWASLIPQLLDTYMPEGDKCLSRYTNPEFFVNAWIMEMQKDYEEAKR